jgi:cellulose synthase/poly-beta-1,6-N-acetylglucosamine synthase-like glycosyltransferase
VTKFSIIMPFKEMNDYVRESVGQILQLSSRDWELLLVPDEPFDAGWPDARIRVLPSGRVGPAAKRDAAAAIARGDILVFLDDDSYPRADLLDVAAQHFEDSEVVALGGPGITPPQDTFWQHVSGAVFLSVLSGGAPERYVPIGHCRDVQDWPSVNLMVRRDDFLEVGGFDSPYWPGEDTKLCLHLIKKTGRRIVYVPELVVWHHRRAGLRRHLRQVAGYGLHRGFFVKRYPETSRKALFFGPSAVVLLASLSLFVPVLPQALTLVVGAGWLIYGGALTKALWDFVRYEKLSVALCALWFTFFTHLVYGVRFLQGLLFTTRLVSTLR